MVAIDLYKAFNTVDHEISITDIYKLKMNENIRRFVVDYLSGKYTFVEFRGTKSKYRLKKQGVPQGGVLQPCSTYIS